MLISSETKTFSRTQPLLCSIKERYLLSKSGSTKQTYHIVLDLKGADFPYKEGDSIAILPQNDPERVQEILSLLKATGREIIEDRKTKEHYTLKDYLLYRVDLSKSNSSLAQFLLPADKTIPYPKEYEPADLLRSYPTNDIASFCQKMMPLLPRFYSIASSSLVHPDEIHLTVVISTYTHQNQPRLGIASHFLCHLATLEETPIPIYYQKSRDFHLPKEPNTPIIMIGPGTGIAPFRAFLQQRIASQSRGKNWLFFGERNQKTDFFYQEELHSLVKNGTLQLSTAFSRDQKERLYVQHEMEKCAGELWQWIEEGAIIYICGDANSMAKSVTATLHTIFEKEGNRSPDSAKAYFKQLRKEHRIRLDVY